MKSLPVEHKNLSLTVFEVEDLAYVTICSMRDRNEVLRKEQDWILSVQEKPIERERKQRKLKEATGESTKEKTKPESRKHFLVAVVDLKCSLLNKSNEVIRKKSAPTVTILANILVLDTLIQFYQFCELNHRFW